jgi:hypothetical protein
LWKSGKIYSNYHSGPGFQRNFISHKEGLGQMASPVPQFLACIFPKFMNKYN